MISGNVETIVTNFKRPENVRRIAQALKDQSVPIKLTIVDNDVSGFQLDAQTLALANLVIRPSINIGPFCRYYAAFCSTAEFVYIHDDDMLPGKKVIEHFLTHAESGPNFGVLGQHGRIAKPNEYDASSVSAESDFVEVDSVVRAYFVRTSNLHHLLRLRNHPEIREKCREDDLMLCSAMRLYGNLPILLTPKPGPGESVNATELLAPHAQCRRPDHYQRRTEFLRWIQSLGWKILGFSLANEQGKAS